MALVGFAQTIAIGKTLAQRQGHDIRANQELVALGLSNMASSLSQAFPVSGGLSRSMVNAKAGARTPVAALITAALVAASLVWLASAFRYLPKAALAALILVSAVGLIDLAEIRYLFRVKKTEGLVLVFTFVATLTLGIAQGLAAGVVASILLFIGINTRPNTALLGRLPGTDIFRNVDNFPEAQTLDGVAILRIDSALYFANTEFLKARFRALAAQPKGSLRAIVLDASAVSDLDSSADTALHQICAELKGRGIELYIAGIKSPVREVMKRSGLYERLGGDHFFFTIDAAVKRLQGGCNPPSALM
jgi:SulP family sulfate permease